MPKYRYKVKVESPVEGESGIYSPNTIVMDGEGNVERAYTEKYRFKDDTCNITLIVETGDPLIDILNPIK